VWVLQTIGASGTDGKFDTGSGRRAISRSLKEVVDMLPLLIFRWPIR
jgi:hypothetical protein